MRLCDELDRSQSLSDLVELAKNKYSIRIKGNVINIYPKRNINGKHIIRLYKEIKAKNGNKIFSEKVEQSVSFNDSKPQIKFVGKGIILPPNTILDIPFDAVGVSSVDVTAFKIYPENIV